METFEIPTTSPSKQSKRRVHWDQVVKFIVIPHLTDFNDEEYDDLWWNKSELRTFAKNEAKRRADMAAQIEIRRQEDVMCHYVGVAVKEAVQEAFLQQDGSLNIQSKVDNSPGVYSTSISQ